MRHPAGDWTWVAHRGDVISTDPAGRPRRMAGIVQDITAYRTAEAALASELVERGTALRDSERRFERLVQGVTDFAIFMLDPQGRITTWNSGARRIKGYEAEEILGRSYACFYTDEDRANGLPQRALAIALREGHYEAEGWRLRRDGSRFWASVVIDAIADDAGQPAGFAKITRDITAPREMQRQLMQAQKMEAVGQLTGGIAHDFNNLLQAVSSNLELARITMAQGGAARTDRLIANALRAIRRGAHLTTQLLAFSRRQVLHAERCRVSDVAHDMAELLRRGAGDAVQVVVSAAPDLWSCRIDPGQLQSALLKSGAERTRRHPAGRHGDDRDGQCAPRRRSGGGAGPAGGRLRACHGRRHRHRHVPRDAGAGVRAVLHHQAGRQGLGTRPAASARFHQTVRRLGFGAQRAGAGHDIVIVFSA